MEIRKAEKSDLNEIRKLFEEGFSEEPYNERWDEKKLNLKLLDYFELPKFIWL